MIVVYTCIAGTYDRLIRQPALRGVSYVCFTDDTRQGPRAGWGLRPLLSPPDIRDPRLVNRYHKTQAWDFGPASPLSIYIDGNVRLTRRVPRLVEALRDSGAPFGAYSHRRRTSVADELAACVSRGKLTGADAQRAADLLDWQRSRGFGDDCGLTANSLLVRDARSTALRTAMDRWWQIISTWCPRDQLSLQFVLWETGLRDIRLEGLMPREAVLRSVRHRHAERPGLVAVIAQKLRRLAG